MSRLAMPFPRRPLAVLLLSLAAATTHAAPVAVDLPAQPLGESIKQLADLSGLSIAVDAFLVSGKTAPAVKGNLEPVDALRKLLQGSGLDLPDFFGPLIPGERSPVWWLINRIA